MYKFKYGGMSILYGWMDGRMDVDGVKYSGDCTVKFFSLDKDIRPVFLSFKQ